MKDNKEIRAKLIILRVKLADMHTRAVEDYYNDNRKGHNGNYFLGKTSALETVIKDIDEITGYVDPTI